LPITPPALFGHELAGEAAVQFGVGFAGVPKEVIVLVIAAQASAAERADDAHHPGRIGTLVDKIAEEDEAVGGIGRNQVEERGELGAAAVDVADEDGVAAHGVTRPASGSR